MSSIKTYSCKYCVIDGLTRKNFIKHTKSKDHKILMENAIIEEKMRQKLKCYNMSASRFRGKGQDKTTVKEITLCVEKEDKFFEPKKKNN